MQLHGAKVDVHVQAIMGLSRKGVTSTQHEAPGRTPLQIGDTQGGPPTQNQQILSNMRTKVGTIDAK